MGLKQHVKVFVRGRPVASMMPGLRYGAGELGERREGATRGMVRMLGPSGQNEKSVRLNHCPRSVDCEEWRTSCASSAPARVYPPSLSAFPTADGKSCTLNVASHSGVGAGGSEASHAFRFDGVLDGAGQDAVYDRACHDIIEAVVAGYNGTVFSYGQTGAGKTYTMSGAGSTAAYAHRGVVPRALAHVFREVESRVERQVTVRVSYLEIYNEEMYDLLSTTPMQSNANLTVVNEGGVSSVKGLTQLIVGSEEEALAAFFRGEARRATASHVLNARSSRSHCVFTVHLASTSSGMGGGPERAVHSKVNLVDLAGSERAKKTGVDGQTLREATYINRSLTFLEQVVQALVRKQAHVPFRQSKLTSVLRDALGGNNRAAMIANVWPGPDNVEETLSTLRFAARVRLLECDAVINESSDPAFLLRKQERIIRDLRQELAMRDALAGRGGAPAAYGDLAEADALDVARLVRGYLEGELDESQLPLDTLGRIREGFRAARAHYRSMRAELEAVAQGARQTARAEAGSEGAVLIGGKRDGEAGGAGDVLGGLGGVGELDVAGGGGGFHVGVAPLGSRPAPTSPPVGSRSGSPDRGDRGDGGRAWGAATSYPSLTPGGETRACGGWGGDMTGRAGLERTLGPAGSPGGLPESSSEELFFRFKLEDPSGVALRRNVKGALEAAARAKADVRAAIEAANREKSSIDELTARIAEAERTRLARGADRARVLDPEEHADSKALREHKAAYRRLHAEVMAGRARLEERAAATTAARAALLRGFNEWRRGSGGGGGEWKGGGDDGADEPWVEGGDGDDDAPDEATMFLAAARTARLQTRAPAAPDAGRGARARGDNARRIEQGRRAMALVS